MSDNIPDYSNCVRAIEPLALKSNEGLGPKCDTCGDTGEYEGDGGRYVCMDCDAVPRRNAKAAATTMQIGQAAEIERLRKVWEDTRTQRDELLAHLTRKEPLPAWAVQWIRVYGA